jgi:hypothetical protein
MLDVRSVVQMGGYRVDESPLDLQLAMTDLTNPHMVGNADEELVESIEELITRDSDDPPFSEDSVQEMLNDSPARSLGSMS